MSLRGALFVADCALESDLPLFLPEDYIPGSSERVQVYRDIDNLASDQQLSDYARQLVDRFGPLPKPAEGLLKVPVVRRLARSLGVERMVAKRGTLTLFLVSNADSAYYQSDTFGCLLNYMTQHFSTCKIAETNGKRRLTISNVDTIDALLAVLREMVPSPDV